jgi:hypothetical protein
LLGHADSKTTQIYAHYAPSAREVQMVNEAFAAASSEDTPGAAATATAESEREPRSGTGEKRADRAGSTRGGAR